MTTTCGARAIPRMMRIVFPSAKLPIAFAAMWGGAMADWQPAPMELSTPWAAMVTPTAVHPEYPRPQMVRANWLNLNGLWEYQPAASATEAPPTGSLTAQILVPFPIESGLSGVKRSDVRRLWYRKSFTLPSSWTGSRVLLHFEAVDWECKAYLNGTLVGQHKGGYDPFFFDITGALASSGQQTLVVYVYDDFSGPCGKQRAQPSGIFYTGTTGIWGTVWLEPVPQTQIDRIALTPDVAGSRIRVDVTTSGPETQCTIEAKAYYNLAAAGSVSGTATTSQYISLSPLALWQPATPALYGLEVKLKKGDQVLDQITSYFGMRTVSIGTQGGITRILLNGKFVYQSGMLDQGFWPDGIYTAPTDDALRSDIERERMMGFNMIRKHVKVEPRRWYYWADRLGMLVWQDMPSFDGGDETSPRILTDADKAQFETELRAMIENLRNHPSIVQWQVFNEGWGQFDTPRLTSLVKQLDSTRLVDNASGWEDAGVGDIVDMHIYPGPASPEPEATRAAVCGEYGGLSYDDMCCDANRIRSVNAELASSFEAMTRSIKSLIAAPGLSASVYTQTTDVESELNGFMTYDRKVFKGDTARARIANETITGMHLTMPDITTPFVPANVTEAAPRRFAARPPSVLPVNVLVSPSGLVVTVNSEGPHALELLGIDGRRILRVTGDSPREYRFGRPKLAGGMHLLRFTCEGSAMVEKVVAIP